MHGANNRRDFNCEQLMRTVKSWSNARKYLGVYPMHTATHVEDAVCVIARR